MGGTMIVGGIEYQTVTDPTMDALIAAVRAARSARDDYGRSVQTTPISFRFDGLGSPPQVHDPRHAETVERCDRAMAEAREALVRALHAPAEHPMLEHARARQAERVPAYLDRFGPVVAELSERIDTAIQTYERPVPTGAAVLALCASLGAAEGGVRDRPLPDLDLALLRLFTDAALRAFREALPLATLRAMRTQNGGDA